MFKNKIFMFLIEFSLSKFSSSESSEEVSIVTLIYAGIIFSLTTYLHSSKKT